MNNIQKAGLLVCLIFVMGLGLFSVSAFASEGGLSAQSQVVQGNYAVLEKNNDVLDGGQAYTLTFKYSLASTAVGDNVDAVYEGASYENGFTVEGSQPWQTVGYAITRVVFDNSVKDQLAPSSTAFWFQGMTALREVINPGNLDTSNATTMREMFWGCSSLSALDISGWNTSKVESVEQMFQGCSSLLSLKMNIAHASNADRMFYGCSSLSSLNLGAAHISSAFQMFYECSYLQSLDVSSWVMSQATNLGYMFYGCSSLSALNASTWDVSQVTTMYYMFSGCSSLAYLNVAGWDTSKVNNLLSMFEGCYALSQINLGPKFSFMGTGNVLVAFCALLPKNSSNGSQRYAWHRDGEAKLYLTPDLRDSYDGSTMSGVWKREVAYYVTYDPNHGTGSIPQQLIKAGDSITVASGSLVTWSGYTFTNWNDDKSGTGASYKGGETIVPAGDLTLYAQWRANPPDSGGGDSGGGSGGSSGDDSHDDDDDPEERTVVIETEIMYRLYNPNSGEHFYTSDSSEKSHLVSLGWNYEGIGWLAPKESAIPVYRLYNAYGGEHHYTYDESEKDSLVAAGWTYEGIGWYSADKQGYPLYREYNPNAFANNHNYTKDVDEHNSLVSIGWRDEGYAWYGI